MRSKDSQKLFSARIYWAHRAVFFAIAQLSCKNNLERASVWSYFRCDINGTVNKSVSQNWLVTVLKYVIKKWTWRLEACVFNTDTIRYSCDYKANGTSHVWSLLNTFSSAAASKGGRKHFRHFKHCKLPLVLNIKPRHKYNISNNHSLIFLFSYLHNTHTHGNTPNILRTEPILTTYQLRGAAYC